MKATRKLLAALLTIIMILSLVVTAFADDGYTITMAANGENAPVEGHTYKIYQIFTGDLSADGVLSNIKYGSAGVGTPDTDVPADTLDAITDARAYANGLNIDDLTECGSLPNEEAPKWALSGLAAGYYLIVDTTSDTDLPQGQTRSQYMVKVVGDVTVKPKADSVPVEKQLSDDNHGLICEKQAHTHGVDCETTCDAIGHTHVKDCYNWAKANDVALGDTVHFKITSTVPAKAADYDDFIFYLEDLLSDGLTFQDASVKVFANDTLLNSDQYTVDSTAVEGKYTFRVALVDAKSFAGQTIEATYDAILNENAMIGSANINEVDIKYSNDPNHHYEGEKKPDGFPDSEKNPPLGETPKKRTKTFVTELRIHKVDQNGNVLTGASFKLTGTALNKVVTWTETFTEDASGEYYKLSNNTYTREAPVTERTMRENPGASAGYVEAETGYSGEGSEVVGEKTYRPYVPATDSGKTVYILVEPNADSYASTETKYKKTRTQNTAAEAQNVGIEVAVGADGVATFTGLAEGTYTITETVTPTGYNTISPFSFTINCTVPTTEDGDCTWSTEENDNGVTYNPAEKAFEVTIENNRGSTLPETGGMGTTLFYIVGGILAVGAGILLISKKRMSDMT